jgi:S-adenosylmethionine-diacylglycerol 3-amino-3-carboxypropyl transferase
MIRIASNQGRQSASSSNEATYLHRALSDRALLARAPQGAQTTVPSHNSAPGGARSLSSSRIRYAQCWEDADILVAALRPRRGDVVVSIGSAGDNSLALLAEDVERVIAVDMNPAQLACIRLRKAAITTLAYRDYLELMGARPSVRRGELLARAAARLDDDDQGFWASRKAGLVRYGIGGAGKFEFYFRLLRTHVLPFAHGRADIDALLIPRPAAERVAFFERRWDTPRWRTLARLFFSRPVMGALGRDPSCFDHVQGGAAAHVAARIRFALVEQDPSVNPYLHWILTGWHGVVLPRPFTEECFEIVRTRLDRLELRLGSVEALCEGGVQADVFNLSDVFEYMSPRAHERAYGRILAMARPGARLAYWNMMAQRRAPPAYADRVRTRSDLETALKPRDKAFFYRDFVIEEAI